MVVKVSNVTKRFNDKLVLDNISFEIEEGTIFGLIGTNGAGKSTLINIMTNLLKSNGGEIEICGFNLKTDPIKVKSQIGLVPQELALLEDLSAYANLEYFGALYGLKGKLLQERINEALEITALLDRKKEKVKKFSGGMKRRLNIAVAIMHHPKILIMDEPTVGVDPQSRKHIFNFTKKICKEQKTTVIYTSHYMEEVEELCSKIFIIDLGKEVAYGSKEDIINLINHNNKIKLKVSTIPGSLILALENTPGISNIKENNLNISMILSKDIKLSNIINLFENHNSSILKINYETPKLEDIFLKLTGKTLRD